MKRVNLKIAALLGFISCTIFFAGLKDSSKDSSPLTSAKVEQAQAMGFKKLEAEIQVSYRPSRDQVASYNRIASTLVAEYQSMANLGFEMIYDKKDIDGGIKLLEKSLRMTAGQPILLREYISLMMKAGRNDQLIVFLESLVPSPIVDAAIGSFHFRVGNKHEAFAVFDEHVDDLTPEQLRDFSFLVAENGDVDFANELRIRSYQAFIRKNDKEEREKDTHYRKLAFDAYQATGKTEEALKVLKELVLINPDNISLRNIEEDW